MSYFYQAISQLIQTIEHAHPLRERYETKLSVEESFCGIEWLEGQSLFPKCYWQSRDDSKRILALGSLASYRDLTEACAVLDGSQRMWGGKPFDHTEGSEDEALFFLPAIELERNDAGWTLSANTYRGGKKTIEYLQKLKVHVKPLLPLSDNQIHLSHVPEYDTWKNNVLSVVDGINQGTYDKVVLARQTRLLSYDPIKMAQILKASQQKNPNSYHFMLSPEPNVTFIGSTPERLYLRQNRQLDTEALAGTIGRGDNAFQDTKLANWLARDGKNINENQLVVDDIRQSLLPLTETIESQSEPDLLRLRQMYHLKRGIKATLKIGVDEEQLLSSLQPTAAVCGFPRAEALQCIRHLEPFSRGWYAGSVGFVSRHTSEFCVAIRSALQVQGDISLYAGAGIVAESQPQLEWEELNKKLATLLSLIPQSYPLGAAS